MHIINAMPGYIPLGNQRDFGHTIQVDLTAWDDLNADDWKITYTRPGESATYPVPDGDVSVDDNVLTWTISEAVTAINGAGSVVIEAYRGGEMLKHSDRIMTIIGEGHEPAGEAPEPVADWIADATQKLAEVDHFIGETIDATESANAAAGLTNDAIDRANAISETMEDTAPKWAGVDIDASALPEGASPTASIAQDETGTSISLGIPKGDKGDTGNGIDNIARTSGDGSPGTTDTYTITYTDTTTTTFTVYNGQDYQQDFPMTWAEFRNHVRQGTIDRYFAVGDQFNVTKGETNLVFDIVDIGSSTRNTTANGNAPTDPNYFTQFPNAKPVTLLMHDVIYGIQFDAPEANYQITTEIASGEKCNISLESNTIAAATYNFTAPSALVAGGRLRIHTAGQLRYYATPTSDPVNIAMVAGDADAEYISITAKLSAQNHKERVTSGSNKYTESAIRQWLNAGGAAGSFWTSKSDYDLAPSWHSTLAGFRNGLDPDLLAVLGETTREVELNTVTDGGGHTTISDKIFLPSRMEIYGSAETAEHKGLQFHAYVGTGNADKIKYDSTALSTTCSWWVRSPNESVANIARIAVLSGALSGGYGYANSGLGTAAACVIL